MVSIMPLDIWKQVVKQNESDARHKDELVRNKIELLKTLWSFADHDFIQVNQYDVSDVTNMLSSEYSNLYDLEDYITQQNWYVYGENRTEKKYYTAPDIYSTNDDTLFHVICPDTKKYMYLRVLPKADVPYTVFEQPDCIYLGFLNEEPFGGYYVYETVMRPHQF